MLGAGILRFPEKENHGKSRKWDFAKITEITEKSGNGCRPKITEITEITEIPAGTTEMNILLIEDDFVALLSDDHDLSLVLQKCRLSLNIWFLLRMAVLLLQMESSNQVARTRSGRGNVVAK
jgi:hypothetical protein